MSAYVGPLQQMVDSFFIGKTIKALLVTNGFVQDPDSQTYVSDVVGSELTTSGYERAELTGVTWVYDSDGNQIVFTCDGPITFGFVDDPATGVLGLIFYVEVTDDTDSVLLAGDLELAGVDLAPGTTFSYTPADTGFYALSIAPDPAAEDVDGGEEDPEEEP